MKNTKILTDILHNQVSPALGCTEPAAVGLAVARAKEILGSSIDKMTITVNNNILKNGMGVGIPGTHERGLDFAAALALEVGKSEYGLEVFKDVNKESIESALGIVDERLIAINLDKGKTSLFIEVVAYSKDDIARVVIENAHTNITFEKFNDKIILDCNGKQHNLTEEALENSEIKYKIMDYNLDDLINHIDSVPIGELDFIQDGIDMNLKLAQVGLMEDIGLGMGKHYINLASDLQSKAKAYTVAASEARMTGYPLPVMSSAGSGNHGLVAIIPLSIVGRDLEKSADRILRSVALSHLVTVFVKVQLGALTPVCGCAVAAGLGCSAGITYLSGGSNKQIKDSIINMIAGVSGMFCDGAKIGCAYKLGISVDAAFDASSMAQKGIVVPSDNGILGATAEESIGNLSKVSTEGMANTDSVILDIMMNKC